MASTFQESDLPGIGRKFQLVTRSGDKLVVVVHDDGKRELYHFYHGNPDESISMISLSDQEARQLAGIIGGMSYQPKALESTELELQDLLIEWIKVHPGSPASGKTIAELGVRETTGANIIAIVEGDETIISPGPHQSLRADVTLVVAGDRRQVRAFKQLINSNA
ncbi:MAG: cation:proton antiporter regulatory subunit [Deinococcota bacterium]|jgi:TrkA domain protein|nr:cation:proton antiporter regulatory subunit [Deinococcota bacterium]